MVRADEGPAVRRLEMPSVTLNTMMWFGWRGRIRTFDLLIQRYTIRIVLASQCLCSVRRTGPSDLGSVRRTLLGGQRPTSPDSPSGDARQHIGDGAPIVNPGQWIALPMEFGLDSLSEPSSISFEAVPERGSQAGIECPHKSGILPIDELDLDPAFHRPRPVRTLSHNNYIPYCPAGTRQDGGRGAIRRLDCGLRE